MSFGIDTGFGMTFAVKRMFFDTKLVEREVGKLNAKALGRAGAFVRRVARSSMRRRKGSSAIGSPPNAHSKSKIKTLKNILFAYDKENMSVVIGPTKLTSRYGSVPAAHEFGGPLTIRVSGRYSKKHGSSKVKTRTAIYPPRPFMGPALKSVAPQFPSLWVSSAGGKAAA